MEKIYDSPKVYNGKWCGDCMYDMSREEDRRKDERSERNSDAN